MDVFDENFSQQQAEEPAPVQQGLEEDPAAAFLAQQQHDIAGLESGVLDEQPAAEPVVNGFGDDMMGNNAPANGDYKDFSCEYDFFSAPATTEQQLTNGIGDFGQESEEERMDPSQAYAAIAAADARLDQLRSEPEKIRQWREENTKLLTEKDRESEQRQQEWLAQAEKELKEWERNRLEQLEKTKESNRSANEAFIKERKAEEQFVKERDQANPGSEWERVSKLCDFNPKVAKGNKDVSRMRSSLLHLKQNPRPVTVPEASDN
uniref:Clathrin light chain n=1 Tax=Phallusia mammillata TaxID=59560 RepID=A0A6F9DAD6_9ASCI|nr:clathrin light chain B-like [Phallusia mammillata]